MRQTAGLYLIGDKTVTVAREGENKDKLKVRVGSSYFAFEDFMMQVKTRMERDAADEEGEQEAAAESNFAVSANLEVPSPKFMAQSQATPRTGGKKKKKKKSKKKASAAELDLDMDNDDASE